MAMSKAAALGTAHENFPSFLRSRHQAKLIDKWVRGEQYDIDPNEFTAEGDSSFHGRPYKPSRAETTDEFDDLGTRTPTPWAGLIVRSLAQTAFVDGIRMPQKTENMKAWNTFQANRWDARQGPVHFAAIGMGTSFGVVLPGQDPLTGAKRAKMLTRSPKTMAAFYDSDDDEWSMFALEAHKQYLRNDLGQVVHSGWAVRLYDEQVTHFLTCKGDGVDKDDWTWIEQREHGLPVPPVARCVNRIDLDGRATGEIEPVLPILRRIDQDVFDRLIVQRFGAWKVRYIAGMAKPTTGDAAAEAIRLSLMDFLVSGDHETKFGAIEGTDPKGFTELTDADLRMLAAVTQTPPHHLLGLSSNLQAEALAAAESGLQRKSSDFKMNAGEFHEQMARMVGMVDGNADEANAFDMQVRWRDTESRSLTQAADALGKMAIQMKIPVEMLWERLPGWTDSDTTRAKKIIEEGGVDQLLAELSAAMEADAAAAGQDQPSGNSD